MQEAEDRQLWWSTLWCRDIADEVAAARTVLCEQVIVKAKRRGPMARLTVTQIRRALACFRKSRSKGFDGWGPAGLAQLPDEALEQLSQLYAAMEASVLAPATFLLNFVVLLPKPTCGERLVTLRNMLYVLWAKCRQNEVRELDCNGEGFLG